MLVMKGADVCYLAMQLLVKEPAMRMTLEQVLRDPWIVSHCSAPAPSR